MLLNSQELFSVFHYKLRSISLKIPIIIIEILSNSTALFRKSQTVLDSIYSALTSYC